MTPLSDVTLAHLRRIADQPDLTGTPYEMLAPLGRGGMGAVYLVKDLELQREVAMKVLSDPEPDDAGAARLIAEARVIAGLEHPGIVPVYDVGTLPDGRVFYTMKRVSGTRLDARVREGATLTDRLRLFERICEPVAFAHAHGVIHRDLKPENVMVGSFGEVLVMDWGLARSVGSGDRPDVDWRDASGGSGRGGDVVGTPGYMSPEQERGDREIDPRSDVYSLGGVLNFLITGAGSKTPRPLASICAKAMTQDPAARYATVSDLAADVGCFLAEVRVHAHQETFLERTGRFVRRYRTPITLVVAYLVMRVVLLFVPRS